jgi:hypothetical protein
VLDILFVAGRAVVLRTYCVFRRGKGMFLGVGNYPGGYCDGVIRKDANTVASIRSASMPGNGLVSSPIAVPDYDQRKIACAESSAGTQVAKAAASIAFRGHTVQTPRDGHCRLCEAHTNGGFGKLHAGDGLYSFLEKVSGLRSVAQCATRPKRRDFDNS